MMACAICYAVIICVHGLGMINLFNELRGNILSNTPVNKAEMVDFIAAQNDIPKTVATKVLNSVVDAITLTLQSGKSFTIPGFGTFSVKLRAARVGRNPKTGEPINIEASNIPNFKAGKALKDAVNSGSVVTEEA